ADVLAKHVPDLVGKLLARHGLAPADVAAWAVHPGGPRILDVVESELSLPPGALKTSRDTLRDHGNCSSATILLVVREMIRRDLVPPGGYLVAMAFGPGLTLYAALLRG
ncbi:MAG: 3-oxoacyl-[acyl-carrier-protein] synthase III C-terminal domain-containing protein, partial [Micromonosporaceae bacterium]